MNSEDLAAEYANIKNYCRTEAAKSFKHPLAPKPKETPAPAGAEEAAAELSDAELDSMLSEG